MEKGTKLNLGMALTKNFNKVTIDLLDHPIPHDVHSVEFEKEVHKVLNKIEDMIASRFEQIEISRKKQ